MQEAPDRNASVGAAAQGNNVTPIKTNYPAPLSATNAQKRVSTPTDGSPRESEFPDDCSLQEENKKSCKTTSPADSELGSEAYHGSKRGDQKRNAVFASRGKKSFKSAPSFDSSDSNQRDPGMSSQAGTTSRMSGSESVAGDAMPTDSTESRAGYVGQKREAKGSIHIDGKKRYLCPFAGCDKTFSTSGHSSRHSRIHTGEKPYHCTYPGCRAQFSRYDNSLQHYRTHIISSKDGKKPKGKTASSAMAENRETSQSNKSGRKSRPGPKASERRPSPVPSPDGSAYPHSTSQRASHRVSNPSGSHSKSSDSVPQSKGKSLPSFSSETRSQRGSDLIIDNERTISLPLVPLEKLRESQQGLDGASRSQDGVKRMRLSPRPPPLHSSIDNLQDEPQFSVPNSYDIYDKRPGNLQDRPSMKRETYTWHGIGSGVSVMDHLHPGVGLPLPSRGAANGAAKAKPGPSAYSTYPSPPRATFDKPMLACSHTFELGSRPIPYPLAGTELDRMYPTTLPEFSNSSKLSLGRPSGSPPFATLPEHAGCSEFSMRRSGSMPSLLSLDEPRLESSNSLLKYSLSSGRSTSKPGMPRTSSDQAEHSTNRAMGSGACSSAPELDPEIDSRTHQQDLLQSFSATRR
ncbi:hypothetical protein MYAM1_001502 [Malassezia yamatoensis]|uniref:C2H2-type domain-containing protein n=1 Tax=Malassezia yamatoensis TaxID=253288 RepID=A0AAJ6CGZ9_9BASI|nr:hypothetical protein MYAM1_001502 [Malassezia yamatoensis]